MNKLKLVLILLGLTIYLLSDRSVQALTHSRKVQQSNYLGFWCSIPLINTLPECQKKVTPSEQIQPEDASIQQQPTKPPAQKQPVTPTDSSVNEYDEALNQPVTPPQRQPVTPDSSANEYDEILNQPVIPPTRRQTGTTQSSDFEVITSKICVDLTGEKLTECKNPTGCKLEYTNSGFLEYDLAPFETCVIEHKKAIIDRFEKAQTPFEQLKARLKLDTWKLDAEVGAWCGTYQQDCESYAMDTCSQQLLTDKTHQNLIVSKFHKCIRDKYEPGWEKTIVTPGGSGATGRATTIGPVVPPALVGRVSDEYISALGAWCDVSCAAGIKATCMDSVGFACEKNQEFKKCIENEAKKLCPAPPAGPVPDNTGAGRPAAPPEPAPVITVQALINGLQKADLFTPSGKVTFSAKITANNNSSCVKLQTSFELRRAQNNELITLPISNTTSCERYDIDLDELKLTPGEYELTVKPNNQSSAKATFSLKRGGPITTQASAFSCTTKAEVIGTTIRSSVEGSHPSYDRINWYIGKEAVAPKGTNKPGDLTEFKDLEPNTSYQIQAEYYSQDVSSKREAFKCVPAVGVKTKSSASDRRVQKFNKKTLAQVLGAHTSPISFDILPSVSPSTIVAINVRVVALDKNGQEADSLYDGIWENGRPLPITVNNPSQVSAVKVTVSMVDETDQFSPSTDTSYIPISASEDQIDQTRRDVPQSFYLLTSPDLEVLEQSIRNGQSSITFIASSEHPVSQPSFSVNGKKLAPDSILCADKKLGPCGYHLTLYAPFVGEYSVSFEDQSLQFSAPGEVSEVSQKDQAPEQGGGGSVTDLIKITISKEDGTDPQIIYENGQLNPADFANLLEGDNRLIVTKLYSNGETKTDYLVVRRKTQTEEQKPAEEEPTQKPPVEETPPEEPSKVAPPPQQPTFSHRTCGDVSGNVIVDVYSDGSETAGTNCEDLGQVCTLFDSEGRQDATCVDKQSTD